MIKISKKESYITVADRGEAELVEKKSKFIATVVPAESEEEALSFLEEMRKTYSDATHNVYAYVIDENNIFRYSDDGEPSGTAGMPVLDAIRKSGIVDCCVVVTRYFGGTLLGTGGLVRAYQASAVKGLEAAGVVKRCLCDLFYVKVDYSTGGKLSHYLAEKGIIIKNTVYDTDVTFDLCTPIDNTEKVIEEITDLTGGKAVIGKEKDQCYIDMKE